MKDFSRGLNAPKMFTLRNTIQTLDIFKKPLPMFNLHGQRAVASMCGACATIVIMAVILLYATHKFIWLMSRENPQISSFLKQGVMDSSNSVNFRDKNIKFAFGIEGFLDA